VMGWAGSLLGLAAGLLAARAIGVAIGGLAGGLYGIAQQATELPADPMVMGVAVAVGIGTSLVGAIVPARNAAAVEPVEALKKSEFHAMSAGEGRRRLVLASAASLLAIACLFVADRRLIFYAGYALTIV